MNVCSPQETAPEGPYFPFSSCDLPKNLFFCAQKGQKFFCSSKFASQKERLWIFRAAPLPFHKDFPLCMSKYPLEDYLISRAGGGPCLCLFRPKPFSGF